MTQYTDFLTEEKLMDLLEEEDDKDKDKDNEKEYIGDKIEYEEKSDKLE